MVTHHLALTPILDFFPTSEVVIMQQIDGTAYKLKLRLFHKSTHLWVYSADFHSGVNRDWQYYQTPKFAIAFEQFHLLNPLSQFHLQFNLTNSHFKVQIASSRYNSSTLIPLLRTSFNMISRFSDQMAYLPNAPQYSRQIHQKGHSSSRSPSSTI